jgi:hypothetical protein
MSCISIRAPRLATTIGLVTVLGSFIAASPALAEDTSRWRTSPVCTGSKNIILAAQGQGGFEFEYRVVGGEPTIYTARPPIQANVWSHREAVELSERQVVWRARAYDAQYPLIDIPGDIKSVEAFCGNLTPP